MTTILAPFLLCIFSISSQISATDGRLGPPPSGFATNWSMFDAFNTTPSGRPEKFLPAPGGIYIQWRQKGIDYLGVLIKKAMARLITQVRFPSSSVSRDFLATNIKVKEMAQPIVYMKPLLGTGVAAKILLRNFVIQGNFSHNIVGWQCEGTFQGLAEYVNINVLWKIRRGAYWHPTFDIPYCNAKSATLNNTFTVSSSNYNGTETSIGDALAFFKRRHLTRLVQDALCSSVRDATKVVEIFLVNPPAVPYLFDHDACPNIAIGTTDSGVPLIAIPETGSAIVDRLLKGMIEGFSVNTFLRGNPIFKNDRVIFALNGGFHFEGEPISRRRRKRYRHWTEPWEEDMTPVSAVPFPILEKYASYFAPYQNFPLYFWMVEITPPTPMRQHVNLVEFADMLNYAVTQFVPNTFLVHVHEQNLIYVEEEFDIDQMPEPFPEKIRKICSDCRLKLAGTSTYPPNVTMTPDGVLIGGIGWEKLTAYNKYNKFDLATSVSQVDAKLIFRVTNDVIFVKVEMDRVDIHTVRHWQDGMQSDQLPRVMRKLFMTRVWPKVIAPVNEVTDVKGITLPEVCGLSYNDTTISYWDGFVSINTNLVFDIDGFVDRLLRVTETTSNMGQ